MSVLRTFSFDSDLPLKALLQNFLDFWAVDTDYVERNACLNLIAEMMAHEEKPTEFVATFTTSYQIAQDAWQVANPCLKVNSNTRISDIQKFYKKSEPNGVMQVQLIELQ